MRRSVFFLIAGVILVWATVRDAGAATEYKYRVLYAFAGGSDGGSVASGPALDGNGNLYGETYQGGTDIGCPYQGYGCGVMFELSPQGDGQWREDVMLDFVKDTGGANEKQPLIFEASTDGGSPSKSRRR